MNKNEVVKKLSEMTGYDLDTCEKINSIMEENGLVGKETKENVISLFCKEFNIDNSEADEIYNTFCSIITEHITNKFLHPFQSKKEN